MEAVRFLIEKLWRDSFRVAVRSLLEMRNQILQDVARSICFLCVINASRRSMRSSVTSRGPQAVLGSHFRAGGELLGSRRALFRVSEPGHKAFMGWKTALEERQEPHGADAAGARLETGLQAALAHSEGPHPESSEPWHRAGQAADPAAGSSRPIRNRIEMNR